MRYFVYGLLALLAALAATAGSDIFARLSIRHETLSQATSHHFRYASTDWVATILLLAPFVAVGVISGVVQKRARTRSALAIFTAGMIPLLYFYFQGHQAAQQALVDEKWTAAALSVGFLPFAVGLPVVLLIGAAALLAANVDRRKSDWGGSGRPG